MKTGREGGNIRQAENDEILCQARTPPRIWRTKLVLSGSCYKGKTGELRYLPGLEWHMACCSIAFSPPRAFEIVSYQIKGMCILIVNCENNKKPGSWDRVQIRRMKIKMPLHSAVRELGTGPRRCHSNDIYRNYGQRQGSLCLLETRWYESTNWERKEHWQQWQQCWSLWKQMGSLKAATKDSAVCPRMLLLPKANTFAVVTLGWRKWRQKHQFICSTLAGVTLMKELLKTQGGFLTPFEVVLWHSLGLG